MTNNELNGGKPMGIENSTANAPRVKPPKVKVMVTLRDLDASAATSADGTVAESYAARRAQYAQRKAGTKRQRDEVVEWLKENKGAGSYRRVSDATVFGTFTLEATPDLVARLGEAPNVESVAPVDEMPLTLLGAPSS